MITPLNYVTRYSGNYIDHVTVLSECIQALNMCISGSVYQAVYDSPFFMHLERCCL